MVTTFHPETVDGRTPKPLTYKGFRPDYFTGK